MNPKIRNILQVLILGTLLLTSIYLGIRTIHQPDWNSFIATISLFVAACSLIITTVTLNSHLDSKLPQIIVEPDFSSRYGLILLKIANIGEKSAFDLILNWDKPLINHKGQNISTLGPVENETRIPVLQKSQELKMTIDETSHYFEKRTDDEMRFSGRIKFKLSKNGFSNFNQVFHLDLSPYRSTLYHETEQQKALYEIQKIPKTLEDIKGLIDNKKNK